MKAPKLESAADYGKIIIMIILVNIEIMIMGCLLLLTLEQIIFIACNVTCNVKSKQKQLDHKHICSHFTALP